MTDGEHAKEKYYRFQDFPLNPSGFRSGSQAIVFPTQHKDFPVDRLAVKLFHTNQQSSLSVQREIKLIKKAQGDEGIVRFYGYVHHDVLPHIRIGYIMEYVGTSLEDVVMNATPEYEYSLTQGVHWMKNLSSGLAFLHRIGIVHRDIKPSNLLIKWGEDKKELVISDFGCSREITDPNLSLSSGTPLYSSPELLSERGKYGKATDVYSVGRVFWEVLHRYQVPFNREEIIKGKFKHSFGQHVAAHLRKIIERCLCIYPYMRPTMECISLCLENLTHHQILSYVVMYLTTQKSCAISLKKNNSQDQVVTFLKWNLKFKNAISFTEGIILRDKLENHPNYFTLSEL